MIANTSPIVSSKTSDDQKCVCVVASFLGVQFILLVMFARVILPTGELAARNTRTLGKDLLQPCAFVGLPAPLTNEYCAVQYTYGNEDDSATDEGPETPEVNQPRLFSLDCTTVAVTGQTTIQGYSAGVGSGHKIGHD